MKLIEFLKSLLNKGYAALEGMIWESNRKYIENEQAQRNACEKRQALDLKTCLTPDIRTILSRNLYFSKAEPPVITDCRYDYGSQRWGIKAETLIKTEHNLERPRVIATLNEVKDEYFCRLQMEKAQAEQEFAIYATSPTAEQTVAFSMRSQINRKFAILEHSLVFDHIRCTAEGNYLRVELYIIFC